MLIAHYVARFTGGLPSAFWVMWWGTLVNRLGGFVAPFLTLFLTTERHLTTFQATTVVSVMGLGGFVGELLGGHLADRMGRRRVMLTAMLVSPLALVALGFSTGYGAILGTAFAAALLGSMYRPAANAAVADLVSPSERTRAYSLLYWATNLGFAFAPVLAGVIATASYSLLFILNGAATFAYGLLIRVGVPETSPSLVGPRVTESTGQLLRRDRLLLAATGLALLHALVLQQAYVTLPLDMQDKGLGAAKYGQILALNGLVIVLVGIFAGRVLERLPVGRVLMFAFLLTGLGFGLNAFAQTAPSFSVGVVIWTFGELAGVSALSALPALLAPAHLRGTYAGLLGATWGLSGMLAPLLGGWVLARSAAGLWWMCLLVGVIGAVGSVLVSAALQRRASPVRRELHITPTQFYEGEKP